MSMSFDTTIVPSFPPLCLSLIALTEKRITLKDLANLDMQVVVRLILGSGGAPEFRVLEDVGALQLISSKFFFWLMLFNS